MRRIAAWIPIVVLAAAGCAKKNDSVPGAAPPEATAETAPSDAVPAGDTSSSAAPVPAPALKFIVIREDSDLGIASDIKKVEGDQEKWYADVPESGEVTLSRACEAGERFQADPKVKAFQRGAVQPCASTIKFTLYSTQTTFSLIQKADSAATAGDLLLAQANYGLVADRVQYADPVQAKHFRVMAATAAGRVLGVEHPIEVTNGIEAPSVEFRQKLEAYQRDTHLEASGVLDAPTREAISKAPPNLLLQRATEAPPAVANPILRLQSTVSPAALQSVPLAPAAEATRRQRLETERKVQRFVAPATQRP
jgi:hypothetical protein